MKEMRLMDVTARFVSNGINTISCEGSINPELLRNYLVDLFKCLNIGTVGTELEPIKEAFEILQIAERYMKEHPVKEWIGKPPDVWTWQMCVQQAYYDYFGEKNRESNAITGVNHDR